MVDEVVSKERGRRAGLNQTARVTRHDLLVMP